MTSSARLAYGGSTPGADGSTYVLFSTTVAWPNSPHMTDNCDGKRYRCHLSHSAASAADGLKLQRSADGGTNWVTIRQATVAAPAAAGLESNFDFWVAGLRDWRVIWVNGGSAQSPWVVNQVLDAGESPLT